MRVVAGTLFFPRGGSAYVARALSRGLVAAGDDVTLVAGSRTDLAPGNDARTFYAGLDVRPVDFTAALQAPDPVRFDGPPLHPSFEERAHAPDRVFAGLDDEAYEIQVAAWARALADAGAAEADVLHLHHLTPLNEAAERVAPGVPVVTHLHGTELLMLEAIANDPGGWAHGPEWAERMCTWAARSRRLIVAPGGSRRAAALLALDRDRLVTLPNGFDPDVFRPLDVDRRAVWRTPLVDEPRGWRPGGDVRYGEDALDALVRGPVIVYVGRFTEVKRLPLLLEAFAGARPRMTAPASLVIVGGHPGEWEGEHPADTVDCLGVDGVLLAGWHDQSELPELLAASDVLVLSSIREAFGQVLVEAMACGVPPVAAASLGPATIVDDGETGWLFGVEDREALGDALVDAVNRPEERRRRGAAARRAAVERYAWPAIAARLHDILAG